ncbi:MAG TPA: hypothetical protein VGJ48_00375 [Pyrinomonadaceae bacterium]
MFIKSSLREANALTGFRQRVREPNAGLARADNQYIKTDAFTHKTLLIH